MVFRCPHHTLNEYTPRRGGPPGKSPLSPIWPGGLGTEHTGPAGLLTMRPHRLASSSPDIWRDIAATNADALADALDQLIALLQELRDDLTAGDRLDEVFRRAGEWRRTLTS